MPATCTRPVTVGYRRDGEEINVPCGTYYAGNKELCDRCDAAARRRFPQGWRYYPGDVCEHGTYVGGCGADLMCGACESA